MSPFHQRRCRAGRASVLLLAALAVAAALFALPLHHLAGGLLVLAVTGLCMSWLVGAQQLAARILPWTIGLAVFATGWPIAIDTLSVVHDGMTGMSVRAHNGGGIDGMLYDAGTCSMIGGLLVVASGVLLVSAKVRAALPPARQAPRPQARHRARVVEPGVEEAGGTNTSARGLQAGTDDFDLLGGDGDGR